MKVGDKVYTLTFLKADGKSPYNPENLEPTEVEIEAMEDEGQIAKIRFRFPKNEEVVRVPVKNLAATKLELEQRRHQIIFNLLKAKTIRRMQGGDVPGSSLIPNFEPRFTGNPLRMKERNLAYGAQTNTFARRVTPQKLIQLVAIAVETIEVLIDVLDLLVMCNDFAKRVIAKYITIELRSIYKLLERLAALDPIYKQKYFDPLGVAVDALEVRHRHKYLRNKLGAHIDPELDLQEYLNTWEGLRVDGLQAHWELISEHIDQAFTDLYPNEKQLYFLIRNRSLQGALALSKEASVPFDAWEL